MILTGLEGGPFLARHTDIVELDVAVGEQEAQRLGQGLDVEVDHFVVGHCDKNCLEKQSGGVKIKVNGCENQLYFYRAVQIISRGGR